jgi:hypothetical protein
MMLHVSTVELISVELNVIIRNVEAGDGPSRFQRISSTQKTEAASSDEH